MSDYTLPKRHRLVHRRVIEDLFATGKSVTGYPLRLQYKTVPRKEEPHHQVGFSVPKRRWRRAVDRNKIKRALRELYRHHHPILTDQYAGTDDALILFVLYIGKDIPSPQELERGWHKATKKLIAAV